jgi:hypothetical protein
MSWSDHKDDKSRFDGWREFLNEGEESDSSHMSTKLRDATLGIGYRSANNADKLAAIHYIRKHAHEVPNSPVSKGALENALASRNPDVIEAHAAKVDALDKATLERYHSRAVGRRSESSDDEDYLQKAMAEIHEASPETSSRYYAGPETDPQKVTPLSLPESQLQQVIREELTKVLREGPTRSAPRRHPLRGTADPHTQAFDNFIKALGDRDVDRDALAPTVQAINNATDPLLNGATLSNADRAALLGTLKPLEDMINSDNFDYDHLIDLAYAARAEMADIENDAHLRNFVNKVTSEHTEMIRARQLLQGIDDIDYIDAVIGHLGGKAAPLQDETIDDEFERKIAWIMDAMASKISTPRHER